MSAVPATGIFRIRKEMPMHWMNGVDWFWMSFMMALWVVLLGLVVYLAVRLALRPPREQKP